MGIEQLYVKPYCRAQSYLVGVLFAYFIHWWVVEPVSDVTVAMEHPICCRRGAHRPQKGAPLTHRPAKLPVWATFIIFIIAVPPVEQARSILAKYIFPRLHQDCLYDRSVDAGVLVHVWQRRLAELVSHLGHLEPLCPSHLRRILGAPDAHQYGLFHHSRKLRV